MRPVLTVLVGGVIVSAFQSLLGIRFPSFWSQVVYIIVVALWGAALWGSV